MSRGRALPLMMMGGAMMVATPVTAQRLMLDLPAGPLDVSVERLSRQARLSILIADPALLRRRVPAVRGTMTAAEAVRLLAHHARAEAQPIGTANWRLTMRPNPPAVPAAVRPPPVASASPLPVDLVVQASKRGTRYGSFAGSVEVIDVPPVGIDAGTSALVARTTIISSTYRGAGREKLFIRGIADSSFSGRQQSVTGLYFGDVRLTYSAADPDLQLYDMRSVEVLQGPQGTLYGSGALAGIIRFNPTMPVRGVASGSAGVAASVVAHGAAGGDADAMVNLPLTGDLSLRAVGYVARHMLGQVDHDTAWGAISAKSYTNDLDAAYQVGSPFESLYRQHVSVSQASAIVRLGGGNSVRIGGEYRDNRLDATMFTAAASYRLAAATGMADLHPFPGVALSLAGRVDRLLPRPTIFFAGEEEQRFEAKPFTTTSFNAGLVVDVGPHDHLRINGGRGYRLPSLVEIGTVNAASAFGYSVNPEAVWSVEGGYRHHFADALTVDAGAFWLRSEQSYGFILQNVGSYTSRGGSLSASGVLAPGLAWQGNYTLTIIRDFGDVDLARLLGRRPRARRRVTRAIWSSIMRAARGPAPSPRASPPRRNRCARSTSARWPRGFRRPSRSTRTSAFA